MEEHEVGSPSENSTAEITCRHHWLIEPPNGPTSTGVCKVCGAMKEFDNQLPARPAASTRAQTQSNDKGVLTTG